MIKNYKIKQKQEITSWLIMTLLVIIEILIIKQLNLEIHLVIYFLLGVGAGTVSNLVSRWLYKF